MTSPAPQAAAPHRPVVEKCSGCDRILKEAGGGRCSAFAFPEAKWRLGPCSMATHIKSETAKAAEKVRVGQQKQKKK
ncbi:MAG: PxxKW family cysteine-rich protein [Candidatus Adiutrix sp.]|jgi:hypothetical protein|nr:PxxKW family cysteine-rich protein [Candidatus Adiutrix sp.]